MYYEKCVRTIAGGSWFCIHQTYLLLYKLHYKETWEDRNKVHRHGSCSNAIVTWLVWKFNGCRWLFEGRHHTHLLWLWKKTLEDPQNMFSELDIYTLSNYVNGDTVVTCYYSIYLSSVILSHLSSYSTQAVFVYSHFFRPHPFSKTKQQAVEMYRKLNIDSVWFMVAVYSFI